MEKYPFFITFISFLKRRSNNNGTPKNNNSFIFVVHFRHIYQFLSVSASEVVFCHDNILRNIKNRISKTCWATNEWEWDRMWKIFLSATGIFIPNSTKWNEKSHKRCGGKSIKAYRKTKNSIFVIFTFICGLLRESKFCFAWTISIFRLPFSVCRNVRLLRNSLFFHKFNGGVFLLLVSLSAFLKSYRRHNKKKEAFAILANRNFCFYRFFPQTVGIKFFRNRNLKKNPGTIYYLKMYT